MQYITNGTRHEVSLEPLLSAMSAPRARRLGVAGTARSSEERAAGFVVRLREAPSLVRRFDAPASAQMLVVKTKAGGRAQGPALTLATAAVTVEGAHLADITWAGTEFGATVVEEGHEGKMLLKVPGDDEQAVVRAFTLAELLHARGVGVAHPNFVRALPRTPPSAQDEAELCWAHRMIGVPEAWKRTQGRKEIRVAVLDEGVDTGHPDLRSAVVEERDFIGGNGASARPSGNDAHGTACAGIVLSRNKRFPGVAPKVSLVAARIAMDDGQGNWILDDFATADAVDWCWRQGADVLSNSWGGGPPVDVITRAFERARTLGRSGLGSVIVTSAGNFESAVLYPATISGALAVGASNQFDERKTRRSRDHEDWGSCFGPSLALLGPGVRICATDISGPAGYSSDDFTKTFNGTSAAAPHVAGAAALVLSIAPGLRAAQVREILLQTAVKLAGQTQWTPELGHGRLSVSAAVAAAASPPPSPTIVGGLASPRASGRARSRSVVSKGRRSARGAKARTKARARRG